MKRAAYFLLALALLAPLRAEPPQSAKDKQAKPPKPAAVVPHDQWTVDDVLLAASASDFQFAPDGRSAAWVRTAMDADKGEAASQLMRTDFADGKEVQLTRGPDRCTVPRWSPDGQLLAFLSDRTPPTAKDKPAKSDDSTPIVQVWLMDPFGGEPWALTDLANGVVTFQWAGNDAVVVIAREAATLRESTITDDKKDDSIVVEDEKHEPPQRLFKVDVSSKKLVRLTDNPDRVTSLAVSPDGKYAVTVHSRSLRYEYDNKIKPAAYLYDLETGAARRLFDDPEFNLGPAVWAPDGKGFYVTNRHSNAQPMAEAVVLEIYYYDLAGQKYTKVDLDWPNGLAAETPEDDEAAFDPTDDGFVALLAAGVHNRAARYVRSGGGWKRAWLDGEHADSLQDFRVAPGGKSLVYCCSTASTPTQWYHARLDGARIGEATELAELNPDLADLPHAKTEVVKWKGALDEEVEGVLYYPHSYKEGQKYPLVVMIHGGPFGVSLDEWDDDWGHAPNLYAQRGAFVLRPNYHGSSNYGLKWAESIAAGKYYDLPLADIERGVDALVARGLVDADRQGVLGWSNGAILTMALLTRSPRWKAAAAGAGGAEWVADWGTCEFGDEFDRYYFGKSPLEDPQLYLKLAPLYQFDKVRTPTLLFQGDADRTVPVHHAWTQFRALQQVGKAEVRLVLFPGEKHELEKLAHQRRKLEEELAWFDKYLFLSAKEDNEALKADSPLARALTLKGAARDGGRFGVPEKAVLVPETVKYGRLWVGRFEVTRAQFAAFDKGCAVPTGTENYPANGVSFGRARDYCAWLSAKTGRVYRLPNEDEAEKLYEKSDGEENTLDYWAGYAVNPEDARLLRAKAQELGGTAPLLRPVGSFHGAGEDGQVFDLGGNVAEWVVKKDGTGMLKGGSADQPADARQADNRAAPEYQGFRVVEEK